jgi:VWFA-related protein
MVRIGSKKRLVPMVLFYMAMLSGLCGQAGAQKSSHLISLEVPLRVDVEFVTLNLSVRDKDQHYVDNLKKEDFIVSEDGNPRPIDHFDSEAVPLSVIVLLDLSNSTKSLFTEMKRASDCIDEVLDPQDEIAAIAFSNYPWLLKEFSRKRYLPLLLESSFWEFSGATNIYDSVYLASRKLGSLNSHKRRLIILISDGQGNRGAQERALKALQESQSTLLAISVGRKLIFKGTAGIPRQLAKASGGSVIRSGPQLKQELQTALQRMRSSYVIGFVSSHKKDDSRLPQLRISISQDSPFAPLGLVLEGGQAISTVPDPVSF